MTVSERKRPVRRRAAAATRDGTIQSAARAIQIIRALTYAAGPKSLAELSSELGLHKVTLVRLLRTLMAEGVAVQDAGTKRYAWNPASLIRLVALANPLLAVGESVQQALDEVAATSGGTVLLFVANPAGGVAHVAARAYPPTPVRFELKGWPPCPLHSIASGKCYLAYLPEAELEAYIRRGLVAVTDHTITSPERLREELEFVREHGYALNRKEAVGQSDGLAVPLYGASGNVIGGLAVAYPVSYPKGLRVAEVAGTLRQCAGAISAMLSYERWASRVREFRSRARVQQLIPDSPDPGFGDDAMPAVRSAARALRILTLLFSVPEGMPVGEIARRRGLSVVTATRLLRTLEREHVVVRDAPGRGYRISPMPWIRIASAFRSAAGLAELTRAVLQRLADATGVMSSITVPDPTGRMLVDQQVVIPDRPVRINPNDDVFPPLHATSGGKCYLAFQSPGLLDRYIGAGLPAWTEATITSACQLRRDLALTRERGYALNVEESSAGVGAMAVPLRDVAGRVVGAVTLASVVTEFTKESIREWLPLLREAAERLSEILAPDWRERLSRPA